MSKIGILCIATNKYIRYVEPLWNSAKQHFLNGHELSMFVFTNQPDAPTGTTRIQHEHAPWPAPTLMRYHTFMKSADLLAQQDYLFYSDADMLFVDTVGDEVLGDLVATTHPGFYNKPRREWTYETRPESAAYIAPTEGTAYFAGGFNGGKPAKFLEMASACTAMVDHDAALGITPIWHDESCMNRWLSRHPPTTVLTPSYCYPESWSLPFKKRLLALDKDHHELRLETA